MKRHYTILYIRAMAALMLATLVACSGNGFPFSVDDEDYPTPVAETLSVDQTDMSFKAEGESKTLRITSNTTWRISIDATWLTPSQNEGSGNASVTLTAKENSDTKERSANVFVIGADKTIIVNVKQGTSDEMLIVSTSSVDFKADGETKSITVTANVAWSVQSNTASAWLTSIKTNDNTLSLTAAKNSTTQSRVGTVTIKGEENAIEIIVTQGANNAKDTGTLEDPFNAAAANAYTSALAAGAESDKDVYIKGKIIEITDKNQFSVQYGNCTFYISDDGTDSGDKFYVFRTLYLGNKKYTEGILPKAGDEVIICGRVTNYQGNTPETAANKSYIYSLNGRTSANEESPAPAGPVAVDLGLPSGTKWANMNVGAEKPEDYGDYFAWGETQPKDVYNEETYQYYQSGGYVNIGSDIAGTEYDAATANWGAPWRMPSMEQIMELLGNTTSEWTTVNGVNGLKFTSKKNSNSIFLPAAGGRRDSGLNDVGTNGYFWSSTPSDVEGYAYGLGFDSGVALRCYFYRSSGQSVRPVR